MSHQFAPVAPLASLEQLDTAGQLGHYQLLIAPIVLDNITGYQQFFARHPDQLTIVDNGVIELGHPIDPIDLYKAAAFVRASVIVLPDTIDDGVYTAKQVDHAVSVLRRMRPHPFRSGGGPALMGVVQGTTLEECLECARWEVEVGVDWLAVPRGLTKNLGSRVQLTVALAEAYELPIHILGFSDNVADDIATAVCHDFVRGIDAATPCWLHAPLPESPPTADPGVHWGRRPENFWSAPAPRWLELNVQIARQWLRAAKAARIAREEPAEPADQLTQP